MEAIKNKNLKRNLGREITDKGCTGRGSIAGNHFYSSSFRIENKYA